MQGQAKDMEIAALHIQKLKERLYSILSENTQQSNEALRRDLEAGITTWTQREVLACGFGLYGYSITVKFCPFIYVA